MPSSCGRTPSNGLLLLFQTINGHARGFFVVFSWLLSVIFASLEGSLKTLPDVITQTWGLSPSRGAGLLTELQSEVQTLMHVIWSLFVMVYQGDELPWFSHCSGESDTLTSHFLKYTCIELSAIFRRETVRKEMVLTGCVFVRMDRRWHVNKICCKTVSTS